MHLLISIVSILFLAGCASLGRSAEVIVSPIDNASFKPSVTWSKPIIQIVRVPAKIRGGVFIPEHTTYVIIRPGEYIINTDNLRGIREFNLQKIRVNHNIPMHEKLISPSGGTGVVVSVYRHSMELKENKVINIKNKPFLLKDIVKHYALYEREPVQIVKNAYAFNIDDHKATVYINDGKNIEKITLTQDEVLITKDGYILQVKK